MHTEGKEGREGEGCGGGGRGVVVGVALGGGGRQMERERERALRKAPRPTSPTDVFSLRQIKAKGKYLSEFMRVPFILRNLSRRRRRRRDSERRHWALQQWSDHLPPLCSLDMIAVHFVRLNRTPFPPSPLPSLPPHQKKEAILFPSQ